MYKIKEYAMTHVLEKNPDFISDLQKKLENGYYPVITESGSYFNPFYSPYTVENAEYYLNRPFERMKPTPIYNFDSFDTEWCERHFYWLLHHPYPVSLMEKNIEKIGELDWYFLSYNPYAIRLLEKNIDKIFWYGLTFNPAALHLLAQYPHKICFQNIIYNPAIYELNYQAIESRMDILREELMMVALHPRRVSHLMELTGGQLDGFL